MPSSYAVKNEHTRHHWENVYLTKEMTKVGWYQEEPSISLSLFTAVNSTSGDAVIDIGCGASMLVDRLIDLGYRDITLLDISNNALELVKARLSQYANIPHFCIADMCRYKTDKRFSIWHDRAVFHFLNDDSEISMYMNVMKQHLEPNGHAIIGTFSTEGPKNCSGLDVKRYDTDRMNKCLNENFEIKATYKDVHKTPSGILQEYIYFVIVHKRKP